MSAFRPYSLFIIWYMMIQTYSTIKTASWMISMTSPLGQLLHLFRAPQILDCLYNTIQCNVDLNIHYIVLDHYSIQYNRQCNVDLNIHNRCWLHDTCHAHMSGHNIDLNIHYIVLDHYRCWYRYPVFYISADRHPHIISRYPAYTYLHTDHK